GVEADLPDPQSAQAVPVRLDTPASLKIRKQARKRLLCHIKMAFRTPSSNREVIGRNRRLFRALPCSSPLIPAHWKYVDFCPASLVAKRIRRARDAGSQRNLESRCVEPLLRRMRGIGIRVADDIRPVRCPARIAEVSA